MVLQCNRSRTPTDRRSRHQKTWLLGPYWRGPGAAQCTTPLQVKYNAIKFVSATKFKYISTSLAQQSTHTHTQQSQHISYNNGLCEDNQVIPRIILCSPRHKTSVHHRLAPRFATNKHLPHHGCKAGDANATLALFVFADTGDNPQCNTYGCST